jgi:hypothetical protein
MCPWWYRQSSNAATIAFGMEIDVASYLDSAHGACEELGVELEARTGYKAVQHVKIRGVAARRR